MARVELQGFLETLKIYPPRQRPASFTIDQLMEGLYQRAE
jgi:arylsulfatase